MISQRMTSFASTRVDTKSAGIARVAMFAPRSGNIVSLYSVQFVWQTIKIRSLEVSLEIVRFWPRLIFTALSHTGCVGAVAWRLRGTVGDLGRDGDRPILHPNQLSQVRLTSVFPCVPVLTLCSRCHHSGFVDRQDLEAHSEIHCPFAACDHVWCKNCQQTIEPGGPKHSCDGTAELDHLMKQQGWRYCPSELDPTRRVSTLRPSFHI